MNRNWVDFERGRTWVLLFSVILVLSAVGGYAFYQVAGQRIRAEKLGNLKAVGELKARQIVQWREERLNEVARSAECPFFGERLQAWLEDSANPALRDDLIKYLKLELANHSHCDALLLDTNGRVLMAAKDNPDPSGAATMEAVALALEHKKAVLSELFPCSDGNVNMDAVAPVLDAGNRPVACVVLRSDVTKQFFPILLSWPVPSRSAETLLVRKDGNDVLYLNELRFQTGTALSVRMPLTRRDLSSVQAVTGKEGMFEGRDYRGVEVLAELRPVPGSNWFMVAKADRSEILAELHYRAWTSGFFVLLLVLLDGMAVAFFYRQRQLHMYRALHRSDQEQKKARGALRESEEKYRELVECANSIILRFDRSGKITFFNGYASQFFGYSQADIIGQNLVGTIVPATDSAGRDLAGMTRDIEAHPERYATNQNENMRRDGSRVWVAWTNRPILDDRGQCVEILAVGNDITSLKWAEEALRQSEKRLELALSAAKAGLWDWDIATDHTMWSKQLFDLFGLDPACNAPSVALWESLLHPEDAKAAAARLERALREHTPLNSEYRIVLPDGGIRWINALGESQYDGQGQPVRMSGMCIDITERMQAREEVWRNEGRLKRLTDILQYPARTVQDFLDYALDQAIQMTGSRIGYIYHYHEDRREFVLNTWSRDVMAACAVTNPTTCYELDKTGIWGEAVRQRRAIVVNDFQTAHPLMKGYPEGHVRLRKFMTVPVFNGDSIVGVVGLANSETDYGESDILQVSLLMEAV